jgi:predicted RNA-binding Zn ribbon-like protein
VILVKVIHVFVAIARKGSPTPIDLDALRAAYCAALQHARLTPAADGGYVWDWIEAEALDRVIWPIARSAIELLTSPEVARVKECANAAGCGWLFLDRSKNGSRRWCSMDECGSRDKMRRQYARRVAGAASRNG